MSLADRASKPQLAATTGRHHTDRQRQVSLAGATPGKGKSCDRASALTDGDTVRRFVASTNIIMDIARPSIDARFTHGL